MLTNALLEEGAGDWSADVIADRLERVGARLGTGARRDSAFVSLRSLTDPRYLQPAVETAARLLKEPTFAPETLNRVRQQMLSALQERAQSPGAIAQDAFYQALYGDHPYGSPPHGTAASLNAITRDDVLDFHRRHYTTANAVVAIVGDLDRAGAERLADALVGGLAEGETIPPPPVAPPLTASQTLRIPHPSSQSHILIGQVGISRTDPDYYALDLGNHLLGGGGLVSIMAQEIREQRGLAYSVYSAFTPMRQAGPFLVNLQTRNDQADTALEVARTTLREFTTDGPDTQALEEARQNITGGFALDLAGNSKLANYLGVIAFYGLPLDYLKNFIGVMNDITLEQVRTAWQRHVRPERTVTVIVGGEPIPLAPPAAPDS
jgi:zinc protease